MPGFGDQTDTILRAFAGRAPDQVGYVVRDLEAGVRQLGPVFGVRRWVGWRYADGYLPLRRFRGQPGDFTSHGVVAEFGPSLEIIAPLSGESVFSVFLDRSGPGLHHLGYFVQSVAEERARMAALGFDEIQYGGGHGMDGDGHISFYQALPDAPTYIELIEPPKRRFPQHFEIVLDQEGPMTAKEPWRNRGGAAAEAALSEDQRRIRDGFIRRRGYWADDWQLILEMAPGVMEAYTDVSAYAWEHGTLDRKTREFMYIATTGIVTHIHPIGIETHGRNAIAAGATAEELVTLLALLSGVGIRGYLMTVEVLEEVSPGSTGGAYYPADQLEALRADYTRIFGIWDDRVGTAIAADPGYFAAFLKWADVPRNSGVLGPKVVALVSIAANATVTHLDRWTLKREIGAALAMGVTPAEILEVTSMTAGVSVHSLTVGAMIVADLVGIGDQP